ncbi:MAG: O-antigen ligase family protein, partial [Bacteroidetes bacterium]|nr:O-antigen ligase family protein [Bacteroidota bacterium]
MELSVKQKLFYFFPVLFCFCLPFGGLVLSGIIILWGITSFFNIGTIFDAKGFRNPTLLLLYLFFFLTLVSAVLSTHREDAVFNVEVKLSLIFVPYYLFCFKWPAAVLKRCLISFVSGCFFASLYLIVRAAVYAFNGQPEYFFYTLFSDLIHASYFAMYLILSIAIVVIYYPVWFREQKQIKYLTVLYIVTFIVTIFLCASKLGMISFFICLPILILNRFRSFFDFKKTVILLAGIVILVFFFAKLFPAPFERLNSIKSISLASLDKTSSESTTVRLLIWEQCVNIIRSNFIFGTGVGDLNTALMDAYKANGMTGALAHHLNAHNQYLQTFAGMGVIGFVLLLVLTVGEMIAGILRKHFILTLTMLLLVLNFLVESMLQTSAGTLFFVFFLSFFSLEQTRNE